LDSLEQAADRVAQGDDAAFDDIVGATSARLLRLAARVMGSVEEGEDVLQEAYLRAYRSLVEGAFDKRSRVETWLQRIVTNAAIDALRTRRRREARDTGLTEPSWDGASSTEARIALAELDAWLGELPADQRTAITLKAIEEMSSGEIAETMGKAEGAVEQLLVRARSALRKKRDSHDA
jgi:RNA polymerase sigma-70 factor (ECF subfamily)